MFLLLYSDSRQGARSSRLHVRTQSRLLPRFEASFEASPKEEGQGSADLSCSQLQFNDPLVDGSVCLLLLGPSQSAKLLVEDPYL